MLPNLDVRPTQQVPAILPDHQLTLMRWGLVPVWAKDEAIGSKMINARAEGIEGKPSFKRPLRSQRCLLPASAFFEWQGAQGATVLKSFIYRSAHAEGFRAARLPRRPKSPDQLRGAPHRGRTW